MVLDIWLFLVESNSHKYTLSIKSVSFILFLIYNLFVSFCLLHTVGTLFGLTYGNLIMIMIHENLYQKLKIPIPLDHTEDNLLRIIMMDVLIMSIIWSPTFFKIHILTSFTLFLLKGLSIILFIIIIKGKMITHL